MVIDDLIQKPAEWLRGEGPMSDIVISSRIRLARNVAGFPFLSRATDEQRCELTSILRSNIDGAATGGQWTYLDIEKLDELDRQILVERHLVSRNHAESKGSRGASVSKNERVSVMVNEEDHLRIQVLRSGLQLREIWEEINHIDDKLEDRIDFAFHPRYGYLTACPTNVGTGIRVSVMLHLPGLKLTGEIEKVFRAAKDMRLAVRGFFGEGTEATGDFFQISNQTTLGRTEEEIIDGFSRQVIPRIIEYENIERRKLLEGRVLALDDKIWRSYGVLKHCRTISSDETMLHLSHLRMGVNMGRIKILDLATVNELFLLTQPAHLQKFFGSRLNGEQRSEARADCIRRRLTES
ncbi:MAG: protein arginine kinase [Planctomycetota bacterium]|nr:protein arginine kinase [Planctomycetota bacterium]